METIMRLSSITDRVIDHNNNDEGYRLFICYIITIIVVIGN